MQTQGAKTAVFCTARYWMLIGCWVAVSGLSACTTGPRSPASNGDLAVQAQIMQTTGRVLLVRDQVYFVAEPEMVLAPGDWLLSTANAAVTIQYRLLDQAGVVVRELCQRSLGASEEVVIGSGREDCP